MIKKKTLRLCEYAAITKLRNIQWELELLHIFTFCLSTEHWPAKVAKRIAVWLLF